MQDRLVIFGSMVRFSGTPYLTAPFKITTGWPLCHGNETWDKKAITRLVQEISRRSLRLSGGFRGWAI